MDVQQFGRELLEDVLATSEIAEEGEFQEGVFTKVALEMLVDCEEVIDPELCFYRSQGRKINAYDFLEDSDAFDLFVSEFDSRPEIHSIGRAEITTILRRCRRVLEDSLNGLHRELEESTEIFDLAEGIHRRRETIRSARVFLLTNRRAPVEIFEDEHVSGIRVSHYVWDIERFFQAAARHIGRSKISVDFLAEFGGEGIPCLSTHESTGEYTTYLALVPGTTLAKVYERWGQRLLERNVRAFLQARGAVNRGIRQTLAESPGRFLAYNNGISVTADSVRVDTSNGVQQLVFAENFQIVNGGQTTASLYEAYRRKINVSAVSVQMKLTVLRDPGLVDEVVPLISQYANSQTKVSLSDFSANHPFHIELENISRAEWAPNPDARARATTHWYYERARGQYQDEAARQATAAQRATWKLQNPKNQVLAKTDVARYEMVWQQFPHLVSRGSEKNFSAFCAWLVKDGQPVADPLYFQRLVAKAILFKECDKIVRRMELGGYKANVNAYAVAWFSHLIKKDPNLLDEIWARQTITQTTAQLLEVLAARVWEHIISPPTATKNVTEWCKRERCWTELRASQVPSVRREAPTIDVPSRVQAPEPEVEKPPATLNAVDSGEVSPRVWDAINRWGSRTGRLQPDEAELARALARLTESNSPMTLRQSAAGLRIYAKALERGFTPPVEIPTV